MEKMQSCIAFAELFFVLYSTTDRTSFEEASLLTRYILRFKSLNSMATVIIVGTKSDLTHLREVEEQEGKLLAKNLNCEFYQISNSEGYVETQELLLAALRRCLEKNKGSPLSRVKDGLVETAKSFRKKSSGNEQPSERDTLKSTRTKSVDHEVSDGGETPEPLRTKTFSFSEEREKIAEPLRKISSSHEDLSEERRKYRNSVTSTASF